MLLLLSGENPLPHHSKTKVTKCMASMIALNDVKWFY